MGDREELKAYRAFVKRQTTSLAEGLTKVLFGDFDVVLSTDEADPDFGNVTMMANVAINSARNALAQQEELLAALRVERLHVEAHRAELQAVVESTEEGVLHFEGDGRVLFANPSFESLTGIASTELENSSIEEVVDRLEQLRPNPAGAFRGIAGQSGRWAEARTSFRCRFEFPTVRVVRAIRCPIQDVGEGGGDGFLLMLRDITQVEEARRAKDELLGNLAHEVRTPLTSIKGFVDLLEAGRLGPVAPGQGEALRTISKSVARLTDLVTNMLDFDRLESGQAQATPTALADVLDQVLELERGRAAERGLSIETQVDFEPVVACDRPTLTQVLRNLVSNAIKYTPEGGVWLRVMRGSPGTVVLEVEDTGIGIAPSERGRIFSRFYRVEDERVQAVGGTGVGLSIVKGLIEAVGGSIEVVSGQAGGSLFRVRIPEVSADPDRS